MSAYGLLQVARAGLLNWSQQAWPAQQGLYACLRETCWKVGKHEAMEQPPCTAVVCDSMLVLDVGHSTHYCSYRVLFPLPGADLCVASIVAAGGCDQDSSCTHAGADIQV